ncbi:unnamed protein product [marine sediment metagenome]|uniref:Uncharacterized protein n=1 Tax=marine sediment metagenome TaxID=412755 RepID=X1TVD3_9ZZZZ
MTTLKEAVKLIQADIDDEDVEWDSPLGRAYKLSFEALKRIKTYRLSKGWRPSILLPGETKE